MIKYYKLILQEHNMFNIAKIIKLLLLLLITTTFANSKEVDFSALSSLVNSFMETNDKLKKKINIAGKQRMLTQRMTKLSLLIGKEIKRTKNSKKLKRATNQYQKNLLTLKSDNPEITKQIETIEKVWSPFLENINNLMQKKETKKSIDYIIDNNEKLLKNSNKLVMLYKNSNKELNYLEKAKLEIVNLAGKQRMLLEKMGKEKILLLSNNQEYKKRLNHSIDEFDMALTLLEDGNKKRHLPQVSNPKLLEKISVIKSLWKEVKPLYQQENLTNKELSKLIRKSSLLLLESNIHVKLIELELEY